MVDTANVPTALTLSGLVTVHLIDNSTLTGEYIAQDAWNIFIKEGDAPLMIPRSQIRYLKGQPGQAVVPDTELEVAPPTLTTPPRGEPTTTASREDIEQRTHLSRESVGMPPAKDTSEEDNGGTMVINAEAAPDEEDDMTYVIPQPELEEEDDMTYVIPTPEFDDEDDRTELLTPIEEEEDDGTEIVSTITEDRADDDRTEMLTPIKEDDATMQIGSGPQTPAVHAHLECTTGPHAGEKFVIHSDITTLGRASTNVFSLSRDKEISRNHAMIVLDNKQHTITDQNSLNGTFVNDDLIDGPYELSEGDHILIGISTLIYHRDD